MKKTKKYKHLNLVKREKISQGLWAGENFTKIAKRLKCVPSTISREVWKNLNFKCRSYSAINAEDKARINRKLCGREKKLDANLELKKYVYEKLKKRWSPEEIANRIKKDYLNNINMRISHETIYGHIYCLPKGKLKDELTKGLRRERKMRLFRNYAHHKKRDIIQDIISISERPEEAKDRTVPGHWEGDLIVGKEHGSALGTLVERTTRLTLLVPLKAKDAFSVRKAMAKEFKRIPEQFKKTLTYDRGSEMSQHKFFTRDTKINVYFADPHSPWQRGTNENTNGLVRQYFPKGTDFTNIPIKTIRKAENQLNSRPRKVLKFKTPSEEFYKLTMTKNLH
jgi:IS30 family transposase